MLVLSTRLSRDRGVLFDTATCIREILFTVCHQACRSLPLLPYNPAPCRYSQKGSPTPLETTPLPLGGSKVRGWLAGIPVPAHEANVRMPVFVAKTFGNDDGHQTRRQDVASCLDRLLATTSTRVSLGGQGETSESIEG